MNNQVDSDKSKLYCNRCGSFDLVKQQRTFIAKYIFNEPRKLHCQSCHSKLSFQQIALNHPLTLPSFYSGSDDTVLSHDSQGRPIYVTIDEYVKSASTGVATPKRSWLPFWTGVASGLAVFTVVISLFIVSPYSKARSVTQGVFTQPIVRLGEVELLRLDNTKNKNADIEVVLLEEPKKPPADLVWEEVADSVERLAAEPQPQPTPVARSSVNVIEQDLDRLLGD
ncbi:MAG: hypothetical protein ACPG47_10145 [Leucothrix sp.]